MTVENRRVMLASRRTFTMSWQVVVSLAGLFVTNMAAGQTSAAQGVPEGALDSSSSTERSAPETCDRRCLLDTLARYLDAVSSHRPELVPLSSNAVVRENTREVPLGESAWRDVSAIVSQQAFADPQSGNVVARVGVELYDGQIAYLSTRLKVVGNVIEEVETSFDSGAHVVASNGVALDPIFATIVPTEERISRERLERIGRSYFQALTDHGPIESDFDDRCDRYHSGQRVTNNAANSVEQGGPRSCVESFAGPWGPAIEPRFPVIDPERGVIVGYTLDRQRPTVCLVECETCLLCFSGDLTLKL